MFPSYSGILAGATSALINTLSMVFFLNLYYTFITYDVRKGNEQWAKSNEQRTESNEQRAKSKKERARSKELRAKSNE